MSTALRRGGAGGGDGAIQFNDGGAFGGDATNFHWDRALTALRIGAPASGTGLERGLTITGDESTSYAYLRLIEAANGFTLFQAISGSGTLSAPTASVAEDYVLVAEAGGRNASDALKVLGRIDYIVDGTPGTFVPGRLEFSTATASANTILRMRITSAGTAAIGTLNSGTSVGIAGQLELISAPMFDVDGTGSGTALLGTNCPAVTVGAPYTWITAKSSDGSTVYIPAWK